MGQTDLYQVPLLTNVAVLYQPRGFIAEKLLTVAPLSTTQAQYVEFDRGPWFRVPHTRQAPGASVNELDYSGAKKTLNLHDDALGNWTDPREIRQGGGPLPTLSIKTQVLKNGLMMRQEKDVAAVLRSTVVVTLNETLSGSSQWSDPTSDPVRKVKGWKAQLLGSGRSYFACSREVFDTLSLHPKVTELTKYTNLGSVTEEILARVLGVDEVHVGDVFEDVAAPGQAESLARVWGKDAILGIKTAEQPSPLLDQMTAGYLCRLSEAGVTDPWRVYASAPDVTRGTGSGSIFTKVETTWEAKVTAEKLIFLGKNVIA